MKKIILLSIILFGAITISCGANPAPAAKEKVQVAILLDTSGSMSGLIDQAKARLWTIVNTLTTLKYQGRTPHIEIALYEYGSYNRYDGDYIRQIVPLTTDLDRISEELFALTTGGSEEFCGTVIRKATRELEWGNGKADMKLIYIAGNEIFEQGNIPYKRAIAEAVENNIYVNTIHCGSRSQGIRDLWRDAAEKGNGKFFNIDHNASITYIETPYDDRIMECNHRLNDTYISYGHRGAASKQNQMAQDVNASKLSSSNSAERAISKTKAVYDNASWDLVDMVKNDQQALNKLKKEDLPSELQNQSKSEIKAYVAQKEKERSDIQKEINDLARQRQEFIEKESRKQSTGDDLGKAITESILAFAQQKGYKTE